MKKPIAPKHAHAIFPVSSAWSIFSEGISRALNPSLLALQGMMLVISIFAFVVFTAFMGLGVYLTAILTMSTGFSPIAIFVVLFGVTTWLMGILAINAFLGGVHYHLAMQAVTRKPIDLSLAWKLSSARWKDATIIQGCAVAILITSFIISTLVVWVIGGHSPFASGMFQPIPSWESLLSVSLLVIAALLFVMQPFLLPLLPLVYFEDIHPTHTFQRLNGYVRPKYWGLFATALTIIIFNLLVGTLSDAVTRLPSTEHAPLFLVAYATFATLVQLGAILFPFTATVCMQTIAYLRTGKPKPHTQFVSKGMVSHHLIRMVHSHPSHSGYLPVKWKQPPTRFSKRKK